MFSLFDSEIATKQDVRARPSKIVAGLEAEKTNEFLIAIARAIDRKVDTTEAVALVRSGNVAGTQKKEPKATTKATTKDTNESKKAKSSDAKLTKKADGGKKAGATKPINKDPADAKKSKSRSISQSREQTDGGKKSTPKNDEPGMRTESKPKMNNAIQNTNGNATVSVN